MKNILATLLFCLFSFKAYSFEFIFPFFTQSEFVIVEVDIIKIAMDYNGYDARKNRKQLKQMLSIDPVHVPWCAGFINYILEKAGYDSTRNLSAASYHKYGEKTLEPKKGDIVLIKRKGGSGRHVAFFYGFYTEDGIEYIQLLGGNQDNTVSVKTYPVNIVVEYRKPIKKIT
jgi:uncharacterized protein (TIGR02594 family)